MRETKTVSFLVLLSLAALRMDSAHAQPAADTRTHIRPVAGPAMPKPLTATRYDLSAAAMESRLKHDVEYLASDELEGRGVRTKGLDLAAEFLGREFRAAGLKADAYDGTPFHQFRLYSAGQSGSVQQLSVSGPTAAETPLALGEEFTSLMVSPSQGFRLPLAFVGYGITAPKFGYDDYAGINVRGKAVIILRHEPQQHQASSVFLGEEFTEHAYLLPKIQNAARHGAAAVILCSNYPASPASARPNDIDSDPADALSAAEPMVEDPLLDVELTSGFGTETLPVVHVRRTIVDRWIRSALERDLGDIERTIDRILVPQSAVLTGYNISGRIAMTRPGRTLRNVVGSIEAQGPLAEETIILGAHYDHLGRGGWGSLAVGANDEIHNGADDNASGAAVLIETARILAARPEPRRRRVLFLAFSVEELGLLGSKRYVQDPLVPLSQTVAMLNLDMVGRLRQDRLTVYGVGTAAEWPDWVAQAAAAQQLNVQARPNGFGPSDHATFHEYGVPVLHLFTGYHADYHRPTDDAERLNVPGMRRITQMLVDLVDRIDRAPRRPRSTTVDQPIQMTTVDSFDGLLQSTQPPQTPPRLGVVLDANAGGNGVRIREVQAGSRAARLGLRAGDVLRQLDEQPLETIEALQDAVAHARRGTALKLEFDRGGIRRQIQVDF